MFNRVLKTDKPLNIRTRKFIVNKLKRLKLKKEKLEEKILQYGLLIDYDAYKLKGFSKEQIGKFYEYDKNLLQNAKLLSQNYNNKKNTMFGYPANMIDNDYMEEYLKNIDLHLPLLNNCGSTYKYDKNDCNYSMDSKKIEYEIVNLICKNLGLSHKIYSGYITSGGTEGNFYGIRQGLEQFSDGIVYYSSEAHYSISKYVKLSNGKKIFESIVIPTNNDGTINCKNLLNIIEKKWKTIKAPAIIVLTWGTTVYGSVDNIEYIIENLKKMKIDYYIHLDAAFYGGIPKNQKNAPIIRNLRELDIDSISVSLHKYIGNFMVGGVVIRKKMNTSDKYITYIGQKDCTLLGSRSILPFSTLYHVNKVLNRSYYGDYNNNIEFFEKKLKENNIPFFRAKNGNTFILYNIKKYVAKKYQLAALKKNNSYHIIIMPFQRIEELEKLVKDLIKCNDKL